MISIISSVFCTNHAKQLPFLPLKTLPFSFSDDTSLRPCPKQLTAPAPTATGSPPSQPDTKCSPTPSHHSSHPICSVQQSLGWSTSAFQPDWTKFNKQFEQPPSAVTAHDSYAAAGVLTYTRKETCPVRSIFYQLYC